MNEKNKNTNERLKSNEKLKSIGLEIHELVEHKDLSVIEVLRLYFSLFAIACLTANLPIEKAIHGFCNTWELMKKDDNLH